MMLGQWNVRYYVEVVIVALFLHTVIKFGVKWEIDTSAMFFTLTRLTFYLCEYIFCSVGLFCFLSGSSATHGHFYCTLCAIFLLTCNWRDETIVFWLFQAYCIILASILLRRKYSYGTIT